MPPRKTSKGGGDKVVPIVTDYTLSPGRFIEQNLKVVDGLESGRVIPFTLNPGQRILITALEDALKKGHFVRMIVLKSRRQGISTVCEAIMYWLASCFENRNTLVLAHDKDTSYELFRIAQGFYEDDHRHELGLMPMLQEASRGTIRFGNPDKKRRHLDPGLRSAMLVETAEGRGVGRGFTLAGYHWAEVAYTRKQEVATGLNIACSKYPGTVGIWESTANGVGDAFEATWLKAVKGENDFIPVFLPWNIDPRCRRPVTHAERSNWKYAPGEKELREKFDLSFEQLKFRRITIASPECHVPGVDPVLVFQQEYPLVWEEAFLKRGRNFFSVTSLKELQEHPDKGQKEPSTLVNVRCPLNPMELAARGMDKSTKPILPVLTVESHGALRIWERPFPDEDYVIAGDCAEGLQHGDPSTAVVLARKKLRIVAVYASRALDPDEFGVTVALLGWYYNGALVGIERNGTGVAANKALRSIHYPRCWYDRDVINMNEPVKSFMGWNTNSQTRRPMLDRLEEAVRNKEFACPSANFYDEARTFILSEYKDASGVAKAKPVADVGCHDDEIIAMAIALQLHIHGGAIKGETAKPSKLEGVDIYHPTPRPEKKETKPSDYAWENTREWLTNKKADW